MVNKCVVYGCKSGYLSSTSEKVSTFTFPFDKPIVLTGWVKFVNRANWTPTKYSAICIKHFEDKYIFHGNGKRKKLKWSLDPIPTINSKAALENPSTLPTPSSSRKPPKARPFQEDDAKRFLKADTISNFDELDASRCPSGFQIYKIENRVVYYYLIYDEDTGFPAIKEAIKINRNLHVQLQYGGHPVSLPSWLVEGRNGKLTRFSMLQNLPVYLQNASEKLANSILGELQQRQY